MAGNTWLQEFGPDLIAFSMSTLLVAAYYAFPAPSAATISCWRRPAWRAG